MEKNKNKPKLRFPGFAESWEQRKLGEITNSYSGGTPSVGIKEYYNGSIPFIRSGEISSCFTELFITEKGLNNSSARIVNKGDILYALYGATSGEVAISKLTGAINQAILAIQPMENYNAEYLMQWLRKSKQNIVDTFIQGGQGNLSGTIVKNLIIELPKYDEQLKIGNFFNNLDNLITLQQRKLNHLQDKKKSLLQKMFPKDGEDFPELRFPEFTDRWKQRKLGEVFNQTAEYVNPQAEGIELWSLTLENGLTPKTDRYVRDFLVRKEDKYKAVRPNDIVYNPMNMTLGAIGYNNMSKMVAVSGYYVTMKPTDLIDGYYIKTWMQRPRSINLYKMCATGSLIEKQRVQYPTFAEINFTLPEIEEQKKIGAHFRNVDNLIALHQRKLSHLQEQKKALLQQMFV